jgi:hypothetical protein
MLDFIFGLSLTVGGIWGLKEVVLAPDVQMHAGIWMLAIMFVFFIIGGQYNMARALQDVPRIFFVELALVFISLFAVVFWGRLDSATGKAARNVCNGIQVAEASEYSTQGGIHPVAILYESTGRSLNTGDYPDGWLPETVNDLQLVACIDDDWQTIETCRYEGNNVILRERHRVNIRVLSASSLEEIDQFLFTGGSPSKCDFSEAFDGSGNTKTFKGDEVPVQKIMDRLAQIVAP